MDSEPWQTVQEVADYLRVSTDSVYRWAEHAGMPAHRFGRLLRFQRAEVDGSVKAREVPSAGGKAPSRRQTRRKVAN